MSQVVLENFLRLKKLKITSDLNGGATVETFYEKNKKIKSKTV